MLIVTLYDLTNAGKFFKQLVNIIEENGLLNNALDDVILDVIDASGGLLQGCDQDRPHVLQLASDVSSQATYKTGKSIF